MRDIDKIIIHCSATKPDMDIGVVEIDQWHRLRGFDGVGYHTIIRRNGYKEQGRPLIRVGAHARGFNAHSIGICMVGGVDENNKPENNFAMEQFRTLIDELIVLKEQFPDAEILGHRDLPGVNKDCPCINVGAWIASGTKSYEAAA